MSPVANYAPSIGRVLIIAGSDSGGGAGIQADIKTVTALGGYAATAITALTAQNTKGVFGVLDVPPDFISQQIAVVLDDIGADAIKTGMLNKPEAIVAIADTLQAKARGVPVVVDPVMVAKGGHKLLDDAAHSALLERLIAVASIVTPNVPEAEALTGLRIATVDDMVAAGRRMLAAGPKAVLIKGGHMEGPRVVDMLVTADGVEPFESGRLTTTSTHGTGCTLASAIAAGLAQKQPIREAVARARRYVRIAIATAPGLGHGHGPLNHGHTVTPFEG
jgi:hydroxymethylpyrimidine/phosphomethylpyrimidine kinase